MIAISSNITLSFKPLWEGIVKIDNNFDDYVSNITEYDDYNQLTIKDIKYHHLAYRTFEEIPGQIYLPDVITILIYGKVIHDYMKCSAVFGYEKIQKTKGIFRKKTYFEEILRTKGFRLEPISYSKDMGAMPIMTSYRADVGKDNSIDIKKRGIIAFGTGSHSADSQYDSARQSITCVFIASDDKPFVASVRKKGRIFVVKCDSKGLDEESYDKGKDEIKK